MVLPSFPIKLCRKDKALYKTRFCAIFFFKAQKNADHIFLNSKLSGSTFIEWNLQAKLDSCFVCIYIRRLFCRSKMNCTNTELYSFRWNLAENPVFFSFLIVLLLAGVLLRWALRSYNASLTDISKNIVTFLNAYIVEFFYGMLLVAVRLKSLENILDNVLLKNSSILKN